KFNVVADVMPKLASLTKKWLPDIRKLNKQKEGLLAVLCEFIYETSARVGNPKAESAGQRTFGATQLLVKHFKFDSGKIIVTYVGKSAGRQRHVIKTNCVRRQQLSGALQKLASDKSANDPIFTYRGMTVPCAAINKYMQTLGFPKGFTVDKVRTAH